MVNDIWINKSDGVIRKIGDNTYTNKEFVDKISNDNTPLGRYMQAIYPTDTTIRLMSNDIPSTWVKWESEDIDIPKIESLLDFPDEVSGLERLQISKSDISKRIRHCMNNAYMSVTPRGIKSKGIPQDITHTFVTILSTIYLTIEKNTTASVRRSNDIDIPLDKKDRFSLTYDIVSNRKNVLPILLTSAYVEPSPTIINRAYLLSEIFGITTVNLIINDIYYRKCHEQVKNIEKLHELLNSN